MKIVNVKKTGKYYLVTFDNEQKYKLLDDIFSNNYMHVGKEFSYEQIKGIERENNYKICLNSAFDTLTRRLHSEFELRVKLKKKFWKAEIDRIIDECKRLNLLDDDYFAKCYIQELKNKGKGRFQIISSLKQKGIDQDIIDMHSSDFNDDEDEKERAFALAERKMRILKGQPTLKIKEKLSRFLVSKGFSYEIVFWVIDKIEKTGNGWVTIDNLKAKRALLSDLFYKIPEKLFFVVSYITACRPKIIEKKCLKCGKCMEECSQAAIYVKPNRKFKIRSKDCILCMCCIETCPYKAIKLKKSWIWDLFL